MFKTKVIATILIALNICISCENGNKPAVSDNSNTDTLKKVEQPVMTDTTNFTTLRWDDSTFIELKKIKRGDSAAIRFRFTNTGSEPLYIKGIHVSCGCTVADTSSINQPILPGQKGTVGATFYSRDQSIATHIKQLFVDANTRPHNGHILTFQVEVTE